jgi:hypothetical protein
MMIYFFFLPTTKAYVELIEGYINERAYLQYIYCKVKPWIQRELSRTIKSRCTMLLETCLSFRNWKQLYKKTWAILFISFFKRASKYPLF